ncbi:MAG: hypothetical protein K2X82_13200 [Gemmataceae bacterium]|nr:hypothetical protein [Gemmataceae bacterium]
MGVVGLGLLAAGLFALFLGCRGEFLPHDVAYLGMTADQLCRVNECRIVHFMVHDRVAFGGAVGAIGLMYLYLAAEPLGRGERWAWRLLAASGAVGFASFLAYLGTGYLDTWHGAATLVLLPLFAAGLALSRGRLTAAPVESRGLRDYGVGRWLLLVAAGGMAVGGATITAVGMTTVFVPEDVAYLGVGSAELDALNPRLVPLLAHDRAGFGGAVACCGVLVAGVAWAAEMTRALRQTLAGCGLLGFGTAVFVHPAIGYTDWWHLLPAVGGAVVYAAGVWLAE